MANYRSNDGPGDTAQSQAPEEMTSTSRRRRAESRWQRRLLPFLVGTLGVLTVFFCATIAWETRYIQSRMESAPEIDLRLAANQEFRTNGAFLLEANIIERRYRQATAAAVSRVYLMFLGFATGMVMALVGATFVLGKVEEAETAIDGEGPSFKASLRSGSPGVILAFFGTALMLSTIFSKTEISVSDRAVYMGGGSEGTTPEPDAQSKAPERGKLEPKGLPSDKLMSTPATMVALEAKNDKRQAGVDLVMSSGPPTFDGDYNLESFSGPGTLSIRGHKVQYTGRDGKSKQVAVKLIEGSHLTFSLVEPDGGRQKFDGFLTDQNDIVGSTSSSSTTTFGFIATRIKQK
jgi:hypothetical protein